MTGAHAIAQALAGTPLERIDLRGVDARLSHAVREIASRNGTGAAWFNDWLGYQHDGAEITRRVFEADPGAAADPTPAAPARFVLLTADEVKRRPAPEPLVEGMVYRETLMAIFGPEATFKSFVALDLSLCLATGRPWQGRRVAQGPFAYVSAEGSRGLTRRIMAWEQAHGTTAPSGCYFLTDAPQLLDADEVDELLCVLEALVPAPLLVTLDTLARCMVGGDENAQKDMGRFVAAADRIRRALGCTVNVIHHASRAGNIRGSTGLPAALDTEIRAEREKDVLTLHCEKQKDAEEFLPITLTKRVVDLEDGGSSVVLEATSAVDQFSATERQTLAILCGTFGSHGATNTEWKTACEYHKVPHTTYYRAKTHLIDKGLVAPESDKRGARFIPSAAALAECQGATEVPR